MATYLGGITVTDIELGSEESFRQAMKCSDKDLADVFLKLFRQAIIELRQIDDCKNPKHGYIIELKVDKGSVFGENKKCECVERDFNVLKSKVISKIIE